MKVLPYLITLYIRNVIYCIELYFMVLHKFTFLLDIIPLFIYLLKTNIYFISDMVLLWKN